MKTVIDTTLDSYQEQLEATRQMLEAVFDGTGRIDNVMIEQTRKALDEQVKFFEAMAAVRDPQGMTALHSAFFSHTPQDFVKVQQQIFGVISETQARLNECMTKRITALKPDIKPFWAMRSTQDADNSMETLYTAWNKAFQDALMLANYGMKGLQLLPVYPGNDTAAAAADQKEEAKVKGKSR